MCEGDRTDRPLSLQQVDHAPVGDLGHGELGDRLQRAPVVERATELHSGAEQEVLRLLGPLLGVDVRRSADPEVDGALRIAERNRPAEVPAVAAVRGPEAVLDLEHLARLERLLAALERRAEVVGMNDPDPLVTLSGAGLEARVLEPAAVVVVRLAVGTGRPDDLRHRVRERPVTRLALAHRLRELALAHELLLPAQPLVLPVQLDERRDLRAQHVRVERLRQIVDCTA